MVHAIFDETVMHIDSPEAHYSGCMACGNDTSRVEINVLPVVEQCNF